MLNLLPKEQKNKVIKEYWVRFSIIALALVLAGQLISLVLLVPSYLTVKTRASILNSQSANLKAQNLAIELAELEDIVLKTNDYLSVMNASSTPGGVVNVITTAIKPAGGSVRISGLFYAVNNGRQQIVATGNASSRRALLDFAKNVRSQPGVASVDLPVSDFAKAQDIDFSVSISMNPQNI